MISMKCLKSTTYAGRRLKPGDAFEARGESDARVLSAIRVAERCARPAPMPDASTYNTRMMTAAAPAPVAATPQMVIKVDGADVALDDMEAEALHALAAKLGVKVHHLAGAKKVRLALIDSQQGGK